ncbi:hypothetical protein B0T22DRAFT_445808 [Podospora appendiculata]|uniref:Uncharacterized protein n=1 Tax=Podospora appendiculata TaxID=314037 RepID=A0AAE0WZ87_9PEZI|nr:hypothetical protein B0T22DRAFT_445808 [Podospora appendiculata]
MKTGQSAVADSQSSPVFDWACSYEECEPLGVFSQTEGGLSHTPRHQTPPPQPLTPFRGARDPTPTPPMDADGDVFYTPQPYAARRPAHPEATTTSAMPYSSGSGPVPFHNHPPIHTARPGRNETWNVRTSRTQVVPPPSPTPFTTRPSLLADTAGPPPPPPPPSLLAREGTSGWDAPATRIKTAKPAASSTGTTKPAARHVVHDDDDEPSTHRRHSRAQFRPSEGTPVALSLRTAADYERHHLRPRIDFDAEQARQMPPSGWGPALRGNSGQQLGKKSDKEKKKGKEDKGKEKDS